MRNSVYRIFCIKGKRKISDSVLSQKPVHERKIQNHQSDTTITNFDKMYTTIADRLRTVNWSKDSDPTGIVKPMYGLPLFKLPTNRKKNTRLNMFK